LPKGLIIACRVPAYWHQAWPVQTYAQIMR